MTPTQQSIRTLLALATVLPLLSSLFVLFFGKKWLGTRSGWFATGAMGVSFLLSLIAAITWASASPAPIVWNVPWIPIGAGGVDWLYLGMLVDQVTVALMVMVTLIATLVHMYSIGYMEGDSRFERFFCYLSLFTFSMLGIVTANGLMQLFVFWELVGLTSYLLIGFWFEKRGPQQACKKAFVMNRIGDTGFLIGFGILFHQLGAKVLLPASNVGDGEAVSMFSPLLALLTEQGHTIQDPPLWLTIAGIGLFFGAIGKSAQFPLHTWLPDAMEGPTPVSSIVHSATMVAAGVYLTARIYPILTPAAHLYIAMTGLITLVMAACMAMVMTDIKRVLAYSTLSQLGYMILAVGSGAYIFALFHLITHAFFKCCLFQCAGSVIHASHHQQDMRYYGGLGRKMPWTMLCYGVCTLAIAGAAIPFTHIGMSGFYSKDGIIAGTYNYAAALGGWGWLFFWGPVLVAYMTPFYMARSFVLTFMGKPRDQHLHDHAHEAPYTMLVPQLVLAGMALISVPWMLPWLKAIVASQEAMTAAGVTWVSSEHEIHVAEKKLALPLLFSTAWLLMLGLGWYIYKDGLTLADRLVRLPVVRTLHSWALNKFYFDALYDVFVVAFVKAVATIASVFDKYIVDGVVNGAGAAGKSAAWAVGMFDNKAVDGLVNGAASMAQGGGEVLRATQPGRIRAYVLLMFASLIGITVVVVTVAMVVN